MQIPLHKQYIAGPELDYIKDCLERGHIGGNGYYTDLVQDFLTNKLICRKALLTTSGTAALEMAMLLIDLKPGDEVIMPSFTFVSTANAVMLRGARPVFAEINPLTLNLDVSSVEASIGPRTRAIIPVHYAGTACDMDAIMALATAHNLYVIEDAAHAIDAAYKDRYLGTIGHMGCFSFHATKNLSCGEGGALLLNLKDQRMLDRADILWEKGTNRSQFLKGEADHYTWVDIGSSFLPADLLAAFLYGQLLDMENITCEREKVWSFYNHHLQKYTSSGLLRLPHIPDSARSNYHIFYCLFSSPEVRDLVQGKMRAQGVEASFHFIPLHSSPMGIKLGYRPDDLPLTQSLCSCLLRLPIYASMHQAEMDYVLACLTDILNGLAGRGSQARL